MKKEKVKEPKLFFVLRVIACFAFVIGITLIFLGTLVFREEKTDFPNFGFLAPGIFILFISFPLFFISFLPKIHKAGVHMVKYLEETAKDDLRDISNNRADIVEESVTKVASAVKTGWDSPTDNTETNTVENTVYCRYCGKKIPTDSKFCQYCGKQQL